MPHLGKLYTPVAVDHSRVPGELQDVLNRTLDDS